MLLQKIKSESGQSPKPGNGLKVTFYLLSLGVAYMAGYSQHPKAQPPVQEGIPQATLSAGPAASTPSYETTAAPTPAALPSATPALIGAMTESAPPVRVEKALAVAPLSPAPVSSAPSAIPIPAAAPAKQANQVTITEPVEIPVKQGGKITGYINLQKGQLVTPIEVENDQIKIKSGDGFVLVPIKSTDMAH